MPPEDDELRSEVEYELVNDYPFLRAYGMIAFTGATVTTIDPTPASVINKDKPEADGEIFCLSELKNFAGLIKNRLVSIKEKERLTRFIPLSGTTANWAGLL